MPDTPHRTRRLRVRDAHGAHAADQAARAAQGRRSAAWPCATGTLDGRPVVAIVTGMGTELATQGTERLLDAVTPSAVVVVGITGAVDDETPIGAHRAAPSVVVNSETGAEHRPAPARPAARSRGTMWTTERHDARRPSCPALARRAWSSLDMETAAIAERCERRGIPWSVFRAISDRATDGSVDDEVFQPQQPGRHARTQGHRPLRAAPPAEDAAPRLHGHRRPQGHDRRRRSSHRRRPHPPLIRGARRRGPTRARWSASMGSPREREQCGAPTADPAREAGRAARTGDEPHRDLWQAERGVGRGGHSVSEGGQLHARADAGAVHLDRDAVCNVGQRPAPRSPHADRVGRGGVGHASRTRRDRRRRRTTARHHGGRLPASGRRRPRPGHR